MPQPTSYSRGIQLYEIGRFDDALSAFGRAVSEAPTDERCRVMLSICLAKLNRFDEALAVAEGAIELAPDRSRPYYAAANAICSRRVTSNGIAALEAAIQIEPTNPSYLAYASRLYAARLRWKKSLEYAEAALAIAPDNLEASNARALALDRLGRRKEARQAMLQVLSKAPDQPNSHLTLGVHELSLGKSASAISHLKEALRLDPHSDRARIAAKEALRSGFPPYKWAYVVTDGIARIIRERPYLLLALLVAIVTIGQLSQSDLPIVRVLSTVVLVAAIAGIAVLTLGALLLDFVIQFHPLGRLILGRREKLQANVSVTFFVLTVFSVVSAYYSKSPTQDVYIALAIFAGATFFFSVIIPRTSQTTGWQVFYWILVLAGGITWISVFLTNIVCR